MQFEPPLGDTFRAYRKATEDVVQWIAAAARSTGKVGHNLEPDAAEARQSLLQRVKAKKTAPGSFMDRLRGKKRQQMKPASNAPSSSTVELSYRTLRQLGKIIAGADNLDVDLNVLVVLKGIIQARKGFAT